MNEPINARAFFIIEKARYFKFLLSLINDQSDICSKYTRMLSDMQDTEFVDIRGLDEQRVEDGKSLRQYYIREYAKSCPKSENDVAYGISSLPDCTVLEVLVALAKRCEDDIMSDPAQGDRTSVWFWSMIINLGLSKYENNSYSFLYCSDVINKFVTRRYDASGLGGPFFIGSDKPAYDIPMWNQAMWFLNRYIEETK